MNPKTVLITGSNKGLGKSLAEIFYKHNHNIILHGRNERDLLKTKKSLKDGEREIYIVKGDLRDIETLERLYQEAQKRDISVLVNNAAIPCPGKSFEELSHSQIKEILQTNLFSLIELTQSVYSLFIEKSEGTIININSLSGIETQKHRSIYCASKWGLKGFTDTLQIEAEDKGINVFGVYPSQIKTRTDLQKYGWCPEEIAQKIYSKYINDEEGNLIMDGRPEKFKPK
jgi:short-subunit dehydrogenase